MFAPRNNIRTSGVPGTKQMPECQSKHAHQRAFAALESMMSAIFPNPPLFPSANSDARPVCEWVMPAHLPERDCVRACRALPPGMPDCVEVQVIRTDEGIERSVAAVYGARAYLVHYAFMPRSRC